MTTSLSLYQGRVQSLPYSQRISWLEAARRIHAENGLKGFFRGLPPCVMRAVPACAAMFATGKKFLSVRKRNKRGYIQPGCSVGVRI